VPAQAPATVRAPQFHVRRLVPVLPKELYRIALEFKEIADRSGVDKEDLRLFADLGLRFRGRRQWPVIRSVKPWRYPGHLQPSDRVFMSNILR
jgi:hypothetical protein